MVKILLDIKNCSECPFVRMKKVYTSDSWENVEEWSCSKTDDFKVITSYHEWNDKEKVPDWCPILVKEN
jgi:hypothetical protein